MLQHPPTNNMNGSSYDQPLCDTVSRDPLTRPPQALPQEALVLPSQMEETQEGQAKLLLHEGYLVLRHCLSPGQVATVKQLMDEAAASVGTQMKQEDGGCVSFFFELLVACHRCETSQMLFFLFVLDCQVSTGVGV